MSFILHYLLPFLFVLTVLVFVHEFGHFYVARKCGVKVTVFSIGFGPKLFSFKDSKGTDWCFSLIPLGGYVKMLGDADASGTSTKTEQLSEFEKNQTLACKKPWQKASVAFAGPFANYILAFVFLFGIAFFKGSISFPAVIDSLAKDFPAEKSGLIVGDKIISIEGNLINNSNDIKKILQNETLKKDSLKVKFLRENFEKELDVKMFLDAQGSSKKISQLGIGFGGDPIFERSTFVEAIQASIHTCYIISYSTLEGLWSLITGKSKGEIGGILSIGDMASKSFSSGLIPCIWFMAILSINLGLINLFPLPVVDGGHIVLAAIEGVRGKPLSEKLQERIFLVGFLLVASLMIYATWSDLKRYKVIDFVVNKFSKKESIL